MREKDLDYAILTADDGGSEENYGRRQSFSSPPEGTAGPIGSVINLSNAILGAGMLGLPFAFAQAGWGLSFLMLAVCGSMSMFTLHLLSLCAREISPGHCTFYMLAQKVMTSGVWIVEVAVIVNCFGLSISYLVVFGELMPYVFGQPDTAGTAATSRYLWVTIGVIVVAPMAFQRTLDALKFTSGLGMAAVLFLTSIVYFYFFGGDPCDDDDASHCGGKVTFVRPSLNLLQTLSISVFAYTAHAQLLSVANEVKDYTQKKMDGISVSAILLCGFLYCSVGYMGYIAFGSDVEGNVLEAYPSSLVVDIARVGISGLVAVSYPLMSKPARDSLFSLMENSKNPKVRESATKYSTYYGVTLLYLLLTYIIAMGMVELSSALAIILSLLGATCANLIAFIIPPLVYMHQHPEPHAKKGAAMVICCLGIIMMPLCIASTFLSI